jgi:hypothetical protein
MTRRRKRIILLRTLRLPALLAGAAAAISAGCATTAQVENLTEAQCNVSLESGVTSILTEQGEKREVAESLAQDTYLMLTTEELGSGSFVVSSPSGADYSFFIQRKRQRCLLRLYRLQKRSMSLENNLTYLSTRELSGCTCQE